MKISLGTTLLFALMAFSSCTEKDQEFYEVSLIHKDAKKKIMLNEWKALVEESLHLVKEKNNLNDSNVEESNLILWHNNGEKLSEAIFHSERFKKGNKNVFVFLSTMPTEDKCFSKERIYKKVGGEIEKYKNLFKSYFQQGQKKSEEWKAIEEILKLLMKNRDFRNSLKKISTDADIEKVRQKFIDLTENNPNFRVFLDVMKQNDVVMNVLNSVEEWNKFVKANFENLKKLVEPFLDDTSDL